MDLTTIPALHAPPRWEQRDGLTAKIVRIMKLTAVLILAVCLHVSASGFSQAITYSGKDIPLPTVLSAIEKQTGFVFFYNNEDLAKTKPVSVQWSNITLNAALEETFSKQPLSYSIKGKTIFLTQKKEQGFAPPDSMPALPPVDIKGRVVDEKGEPVEGVTVTVKGTKRGTSTDKDGGFILRAVDAPATISFSSVNMQPFEINADGKSELNITLKTKISALGEVQFSVNTGYQKVNKERYVGSFSQLDSAAYERRAGMGILQRLDGTVTGVLFDKKNGGVASGSLQIRGLSTLNSSSGALVIVDNFEYALGLENINPNDVENITVLKDAAATSIWGARAGNGVIVITTKKGKYNQALRISVKSNTSITTKPDQYYYPQMSVADFVDMEQFLFNKGYYDITLSNTISRAAVTPVVELLAQRKAGLISAADSASQMDAFKQLDLRRDLDDYVYRNSITQQHYISLSAGNNILAYTFSAGYNKSLNNIQHSKPDDQFTINSSVKLKASKNLEISNDIRFSYGRAQSASFNLGSISYPYMQLADAEGNYLAIPKTYRTLYSDTAGGGRLQDWAYRPLQEVGLADHSDITKSLQLGLNIAYRITPWLSASATYQYVTSTADYWEYKSLQTYDTRDMINRYTNLSQTIPTLRYPVPVGGILSTSNFSQSAHNLRGAINMDKSFGASHRLSALLASDLSATAITPFTGNTFYNYNKYNGTYQQDIDYSTYFPLYLGNITARIPGSGLGSTYQYRRFVSFSGNISYTYKGRYTLYSSARKDGSNIFGVEANNKWKPLWSVGSSWDISQENFFHTNWISSLRVRASYGYAGNPGPNDVSGLPVIEYASLPALYTNLPFARPRNAPNPNLHWEKVNTINGGVDFSLFGNRINGSIDIWQKKSTDLISNTPYPPASGVTTLIVNSANLKGNGYEINITSRNTTGAFEWRSSFGLSHAKTIVTKLAFAPRYKAREFLTYSLNSTEGRIVYGISSYRWAGLDPATGNPMGYYNKQVTTNYGAIFEDSISNQVFNGSAIPLYSGFFGNSFSWKNFTLSANIGYRLAFYFRKPSINYNRLMSNGIGNVEYAARWQKPGDEKITNVPSFVYPANSARDEFYQYSEINVLRGDNVRLQDVRLEYNWTNRKGKRSPVKSFQVFVYVNNLNVILWRKEKSDYDPDYAGVYNEVTPPISKTYTGGINLNF